MMVYKKLTARHVKRVMVQSWICYLSLLPNDINMPNKKNFKNFPVSQDL